MLCGWVGGTTCAIFLYLCVVCVCVRMCVAGGVHLSSSMCVVCVRGCVLLVEYSSGVRTNGRGGTRDWGSVPPGALLALVVVCPSSVSLQDGLRGRRACKKICTQDMHRKHAHKTVRATPCAHTHGLQRTLVCSIFMTPARHNQLSTPIPKVCPPSVPPAQHRHQVWPPNDWHPTQAPQRAWHPTH